MNNALFSNSHIHTPYSYSPFKSLNQAIEMATEEEVKILGINDFFSTNGHYEFEKKCYENKIYPLLNVEYLAYDKDLSEQNIRINDPVNAGKMYLVGKGLRNKLSQKYLNIYDKIRENQNNIAEQMIEKINYFFNSNGQNNKITHQKIKETKAKDFIGERHIAKAIKENFDAGTANETEIRNKFLKRGGIAYVKESEDSLLTITDCINMIKDAGGLPCYPVLFDDKNGNFTEYESDLNNLFVNLQKLDIHHIEIFPDRNDINNVYRIANFFNKKGVYILFGSEHNTDDLKPIRIKTKNQEDLNSDLVSISYKGCCSIASHQANFNFHDIKIGDNVIKSKT